MQTNRRTFIKTAAATATTAAAGGLIPSAVLGANDRVNFGMIGVGGMGSGHVRSLTNRADKDNCKVVQVCDCYQKRINDNMELTGATGTMEYHEVLDNPDVDAVLIATPDHWHSKISIEALQAGKHVYCEKPMTLTAEQAIEVRDEVRKHPDLKFQVGPNFTADTQFWKAHEILESGKIGPATWAQSSYNRNPREGGAFGALGTVNETVGPNMSGENYVDWDRWLGWKWDLAPRIPWNPDHFFRFRRYFRYNGGTATDLLYHRLAPLLIAYAGANGEYPYRVTANGGLFVKNDGREVPDVFVMTVDYPTKHTINLVSVLTNDTNLDTRIFGRHATMIFDGDITLRANGPYHQDFREEFGGYDSVRIDTPNTRDLEGNFIDAIRDGKQLFCNAELGCTTMVAIKMGVEAYRQSKTLIWDADAEKVVEA